MCLNEIVVFPEIIYIYVPSTTVFTGAGNCNILAVGVGGGIVGCLGSNCGGAGVTRAEDSCCGGIAGSMYEHLVASDAAAISAHSLAVAASKASCIRRTSTM